MYADDTSITLGGEDSHQLLDDFWKTYEMKCRMLKIG